MHGRQHSSVSLASGRANVVASRRAEVMAGHVCGSVEGNGVAQGLSGYKVPPKEILDIVDQEREPLYSFSPDREMVLEIRRPAAHPSIIEFTKEELKLAGVRIDPTGYCRSRGSYYLGLSVAKRTDDLKLPLASNCKRDIQGISEEYGIKDVSWSRHGKYIAFTLRKVSDDVEEVCPPSELWVADVDTCKARLLVRNLNTVFIQYTWIDDENIVVGTIPEDAGMPPPKSRGYIWTSHRGEWTREKESNENISRFTEE